MIRISSVFFYEMGAALEPLKHMKAGNSILMEYFADLYAASEKLEGLLLNTIIPLRTSYENGEALLSLIQRLSDRIKEEDDILKPHEEAELSRALTNFETVLRAELRILDTYYVSEKGGYSTINLIEYGENLLPIDILRDMPTQAIADFKAGCRCLAFELSTAVGFHLLRATESVLHTYYDTVAVTRRSKSNWTMGNFVND